MKIEYKLNLLAFLTSRYIVFYHIHKTQKMRIHRLKENEEDYSAYIDGFYKALNNLLKFIK